MSPNAEPPNDVGDSIGPIRMRWLATLDERTCLQCLRLDGRVFEQDEVPPPPHNNCRCCTVPDLGTEPVGSRAAVFGPVCQEEGRFTCDVLIRIAELRHRLVDEVEGMIAASKCRTSLGIELLRMALSIADISPKGATLDRILSGDATDDRLIQAICAACIESNRAPDALAWLKRCCNGKTSRDAASSYWLQAAETFAVHAATRDAARSCCQEALAFDGLDCSGMLKVARAMDAAGNRVEALAIAHRALESFPTSKSAKALITKLSG